MAPVSSRRRLVVNADDFGRSSSINEAVIRAHRHGILTTASLMVAGEAFDEAVALARANPTLGVGLHLTLICGFSTLPHSEIPLLVGSSGRFTDSPLRAGLQYFFQRSARSELEKEIGAQVEKFERTGLTLDHLNGHLHFHLHPTILQLLMRHKGSARAARLTREPWRIDFSLCGGNWLYRISHAIIFSILGYRARTVFAQNGLKHTGQVFGLLQNARVTEDYLRALIPRLPPGDSELYSHPSLDEFKHEYEALISPGIKNLIQQNKIDLIRYQDL